MHSPTHTQPHLPTPSQKKVTFTYTHPHPVKKRSYKPTLTHIQPKKGQTNPYPAKKKVINTHTPPTPSQEMVTSTQLKERMSCVWYTSENYSLFIILIGFSIFEKDWPVIIFLLNTFEIAFESVVNLFVFNN